MAEVQEREPATGSRWTRLFEEGSAQMRDLLGGKGAGLAEMSRIGLPVPPGFTITTEACLEYFRQERRFPDRLMDEVREKLRVIEQRTGKKFGAVKNPLLLSVRSGAKFSMPGMMDTVLNLGSNNATIEGLARGTNDTRSAYDSYRRFIQMFGNVVLGVKHERFEEALAGLKQARGVKQDVELTAQDLQELIKDYRRIVTEATGADFPDDPVKQLENAVRAVFESWNTPRAVSYRTYHKIPHDLGTAVNIQTMVFGNMGPTSGTGVAFTRNPATGEKILYGEYLLNAQGEDVVAGTRTPRPIAELAEEQPEAHQELQRIADLLERHYRDVQDIEFTIERSKLYMLQTRAGKRTAQAAVKIAVDMAHEGVIRQDEALLRVDANEFEKILHRQVDPAAPKTVLGRGLAASPGAAQGAVVFDADVAAERGRAGEKVILVRTETNPNDVHGMLVAQGILTGRGGMTSHAAIVARGIGAPAVVGAESLRIDEGARQFSGDGKTIREGDVITIDGNTGEVILGAMPLVEPRLGGHVEEFLTWADEVRTLGVRANADYPEDARKAREFGAEGIGLCRTEYMFTKEERQPTYLEMIMAETEQERRTALARLEPLQKEDFKGLFREMVGWPVIIRLFDPPLHEFLPPLHQLVEEITRIELTGKESDWLAKERDRLAIPAKDPGRLERLRALRRRVQELQEVNPMLGLRGCRLGILYPEINEMQVRAILLAAIEMKRDDGLDVIPEIMIPLVGHVNELRVVHEQLSRIAEQLVRESGVQIKYMFGTMIELPRAALVADQIAELAEFFSYGTNDLTQTVFGFSRDDAQAKFLTRYVERGILPEDPFRVLDRDGVGKMMQIGTELGKKTRPNLEVGICGEHGGDPSSVEFCHQIGLDYVSCSAFRVPIARLAAAQARLRESVKVARDV
ncbi:MAG: pyruvate phosphate dikinase, pyruvate,orthophosphate dikinase [Armatimonadetes bacterium CSP1-3]|nr:MAG: pyruvate phosphate dikinase, pyruvate,orthophosphate dikinase [Armatimonadetes bacterium CSP1-3]